MGLAQWQRGIKDMAARSLLLARRSLTIYNHTARNQRSTNPVSIVKFSTHSFPHCVGSILFATLLPLGLPGLLAQPTNLTQWQAEAIKPSSANPYYWDYKGSPTMFLGGSWQDNLHAFPTNLEAHLDTLVSVGGNYVRNAMSHRDEGNEFPYVRTSGSAPLGTYDLNQYNSAYWDNLDNFLKLCYGRDILVQIEIWETWDYHVYHQKQGGWKYQPFNPARNSNYTASETGMPTSRSTAPTVNPSGHPFFNTVPGLSDSQTERVLPYQEAFVDKMLSISLKYPNVLYTMNNETGEEDEWGLYWANYVESEAAAQGKTVYVTDMRRNVNITAPDHQRVYKDPNNYSFLDISQNNKQEDPNLHWDRFMYVRQMLEDDPARIRPINNNKLYSNRGSEWGDYLPIERYFRSILAEAASVRFHRPHKIDGTPDGVYVIDPDMQMYIRTGIGMGLSPNAQTTIQAARMLADEVNLLGLEPDADHSILPGRSSGDATFAARNDGEEYLVLFHGVSPSSISVDLSSAPGNVEVKWLDVYDASWVPATHLSGGSTVSLKRPGGLSQWMAGPLE